MSIENNLGDSLEPVAVDASSRLIVDLARRVASTDCTVLIVGESGTGKEVLARLIHKSSPRAKNAFVAVNCAAIPENMLEAMLFGYEKGSFTGAHNSHAGKFEQAQGGTLLHDEITEMPLATHLLQLRSRPGHRIPALSADAAHLLLTYNWPGNVRELDNLLQRALVLVEGSVIEAQHILFEKQASHIDLPMKSGPALHEKMERAERDVILEALRAANGSRREVAEKLGISPRTLRYKLARIRSAGVEVPAA